MAEVPTTSPESLALSKALKRKGSCSSGPTTMYALMEAVGIVDTHLLGSHRRDGRPAAGPRRPGLAPAHHVSGPSRPAEDGGAKLTDGGGAAPGGGRASSKDTGPGRKATDRERPARATRHLGPCVEARGGRGAAPPPLPALPVPGLSLFAT